MSDALVEAGLDILNALKYFHCRGRMSKRADKWPA